jgi:hypothetical protein
VSEPKPGRAPRLRYDASGIETIRRQWGPWCQSMTYASDQAEAATEQAISYLQAGLPADVVAALLRIRFGSRDPLYPTQIAIEDAYIERVRKDVADLLARHRISAAAAATLDHEYHSRLAALRGPAKPVAPGAGSASAAPTPAAASRPAPPATQPSVPVPTFLLDAEGPARVQDTPSAPAAPTAPSISLRDLFAEHSVVILASLGAFLLVVATVLFELYGTVGLGGGVRFGAVVALNLVFAAAGYMARRQDRLRSVGSIYIAIAAVLLPLVGIAAWTFLELGGRGITIDQALAVTATACALAYGFLASRLGLRAYGEMAGAAVLAASWGISGAIAGDHWRSIGVALVPLVFAVWERLVPDRVFSHFQWFAHAAVLIAMGQAARFDPAGWLWTTTLATVAAAYLLWQAVAAHRSRAWAGETALILAAAAAVGPLGLSPYHFMLPMLVAIPLVVLAGVPDSFGAIGRLYRAHPYHLHLAVVLGFTLAFAEQANGAVWPVPISLWFAVGLYMAAFSLGGTETTGYALRAVLLFALASTGSPAGLGPWSGAVTALALIAYVVPFISGPALKPLTRHASPFFYAGLAVVAVELLRGSIGAGHWEIPAALLVSAVAFAGASEMRAVRFSPYAARGLFSLAWFGGVDALNAQGWRGPFDALLALVYVALGRLRSLATHSVAIAGRRWFVHAAALISLGLCFTGQDDLLWWRLAAASGALAVAYWWLAATRAEAEMPWLAWAAAGSAAGGLALAWVVEIWQGAAMVAAALVLTGAWAVGRRVLSRPQLEMSALPVLGFLAAVGVTLSLRDGVPQWSQAIAALLAGSFLVSWSRLRAQPSLLIQSLRAGAALMVSAGLFLGAAELQLNAGYAGLLAVVIGGCHAEWSVRAKGEIEHWYALAALIAMAPIVYFWPYAHAPEALVAVEFVALAVLCVEAGVRRNQWFLAYPAAVLLAPALHVSLIALQLSSNRELEEISFAVLAWLTGFVGLALRTSAGRRWALATEAGSATIAFGALVAMTENGYPDPAGIALLAYAPVIYAAGMQERERWVLPAAAATALAGTITLLYAHGADTILYAAALGVLGLLIWAAGRAALVWLGRHPVVDMHRYLGLGLLVVASLAGFIFPDRTGPASLGAALSTLALLITGAVLWLDATTFGFRPNVYLALVAASAAGYFVARDIRLESWELVPPGLGVIACGIRLRGEEAFHVDARLRQLIVGIGLGLVMGWAAVFTVGGDLWWLVALLIEGVLTVTVGIVLRSRVLLAGGGAALALVSLRALLSIAQAGYLFAAFGVVALVLLAAATALALGRGRALAGTRGMRAELAQWD